VPTTHTVESTPETVRSGYLDPAAKPVAVIASGDTVRYPNTWTHWGNEAKFGMSFADREPCPLTGGARHVTLCTHTQVLGKLAVELAPPEPELHHGALRLSARGWETAPLPAPDGSGSLVAALDLRVHEAVVEHSGGAVERVPLTPDRPVAEVTREVLAAVAKIAGEVRINPVPQEVPWRIPLDEDYDHARYDSGQVRDYFAVATQAMLALASFRAPYRGRSTPVNAWWGNVRPGRDHVLRPAGQPALRRLHHPQLRGRPEGDGRLVAGGCPPPAGGVLRLRLPGAARLR
jgi:hypothetical protein